MGRRSFLAFAVAGVVPSVVASGVSVVLFLLVVGVVVLLRPSGLSLVVLLFFLVVGVVA